MTAARYRSRVVIELFEAAVEAGDVHAAAVAKAGAFIDGHVFVVPPTAAVVFSMWVGERFGAALERNAGRTEMRGLARLYAKVYGLDQGARPDHVDRARRLALLH